MNDKVYPKRTNKQSRALHLLFRLLAEALNSAGLDQRKVLRESVEIPWTEQAIKTQIWKPIQQVQLDKPSTTLLTTVEIDQIFETINRHLSEKFGLEHVNFPSIEDVILKQEKV